MAESFLIMHSPNEPPKLTTKLIISDGLETESSDEVLVYTVDGTISIGIYVTDTFSGDKKASWLCQYEPFPYATYNEEAIIGWFYPEEIQSVIDFIIGTQKIREI